MVGAFDSSATLASKLLILALWSVGAYAWEDEGGAEAARVGELTRFWCCMKIATTHTPRRPTTSLLSSSSAMLSRASAPVRAEYLCGNQIPGRGTY